MNPTTSKHLKQASIFRSQGEHDDAHMELDHILPVDRSLREVKIERMLIYVSKASKYRRQGELDDAHMELDRILPDYRSFREVRVERMQIHIRLLWSFITSERSLKAFGCLYVLAPVAYYFIRHGGNFPDEFLETLLSWWIIPVVFFIGLSMCGLLVAGAYEAIVGLFHFQEDSEGHKRIRIIAIILIASIIMNILLLAGLSNDDESAKGSSRDSTIRIIY